MKIFKSFERWCDEWGWSRCITLVICIVASIFIGAALNIIMAK